MPGYHGAQCRGVLLPSREATFGPNTALALLLRDGLNQSGIEGLENLGLIDHAEHLTAVLGINHGQSFETAFIKGPEREFETVGRHEGPLLAGRADHAGFASTGWSDQGRDRQNAANSARH